VVIDAVDGVAFGGLELLGYQFVLFPGEWYSAVVCLPVRRGEIEERVGMDVVVAPGDLLYICARCRCAVGGFSAMRSKLMVGAVNRPAFP